MSTAGQTVRSCKRCTYYSAGERKGILGRLVTYGYCNRYQKNLAYDMGGICDGFLAFGRVVAQINADEIQAWNCDIIPSTDEAYDLGSDTYMFADIHFKGELDVGGTKLTQAELQQLATIGTTTIGLAQWQYVGNLDQNLRTTDELTFAILNLTTSLRSDTISEKTSAAGVTIDGVLIKDSLIASSYLSGKTETWDGVDVSALKTDVDGFDDTLKNLAATEIAELENIGTTTISAAQWGYLGELDQALKTTDSPTFASPDLTGALTLDTINEHTLNAGVTIDTVLIKDGEVDGVDVSVLETDVNGFPDSLKNLAATEIAELENIGTTTISAAQWGYLGGLPLATWGNLFSTTFTIATVLSDHTLALHHGLFPSIDSAGKLVLTGTDQIGTKATDLAALWDKTTKIVHGDVNFANQALLTTSSPQFADVITDEIYLDKLSQDIKLFRLGANQLQLAAGDQLQLDVIVMDATNRDIVLSRGAANRLDLATGDSLNLVSGDITLAATKTVDGVDVGSLLTHDFVRCINESIITATTNYAFRVPVAQVGTVKDGKASAQMTINTCTTCTAKVEIQTPDLTTHEVIAAQNSAGYYYGSGAIATAKLTDGYYCFIVTITGTASVNIDFAGIHVRYD